MATLGLKDANLALEAGDLASVPLPSGNVWRDRLSARSRTATATRTGR